MVLVLGGGAGEGQMNEGEAGETVGLVDIVAENILGFSEALAGKAQDGGLVD